MANDANKGRLVVLNHGRITSRLLWRFFDPVLLRIASRLRHLGAFEQKGNRNYIDSCGRIAASAVFTKESIVFSRAPLDHLVVGEFSYLCGEFFLQTEEARLSIGHHCTVGINTRIWAHSSISIGNFVQISHSVDIHDSDSHSILAAHRRNDAVRHCERREPIDMADIPARAVRIEDDAWIGLKATILKGVTVGRGAIVAAGAVVTNDVPPFTIVAGNPARIIRELGSP